MIGINLIYVSLPIGPGAEFSLLELLGGVGSLGALGLIGRMLFAERSNRKRGG